MAELKEKRVDEIQGEILHVYDGIEEADNELPNWWLWTFYGAIVFSVFYWFAYHEFESVPLPGEAYAIELQQRSGGAVSEELLVAMAGNPDAIAAGQALYTTNCVICHKERGEGNIGPNLTDEFWIRGGGPIEIHDTIANGSLQAGMPAWAGPLGAEKVQQLTAFVLSIRDTNVPGKDPQGERWVPGGASAPSEGGPTGAEPDAVPEAAPTEAQAPTGAQAPTEEAAPNEVIGEEAAPSGALGEGTAPNEDALGG
jgi:cytochrome c oxidase cbb3-type subunit 3